MKRRDVLKYVAFATGTAISSPLFNSFLSEKASSFFISNTDYTPSFFSEQEFMLLREIANTIIPKTDSPSASDVGVPGTIDSIILNIYPKADQQAFKKRFSTLEVFLKRNSFSESDSDQKLYTLQSLESTNDRSLTAVKRVYTEIKQQVISYYLTSEEIGENYLNYLPVPGYYDPCITLESVNGKAWSL